MSRSRRFQAIVYWLSLALMGTPFVATGFVVTHQRPLNGAVSATGDAIDLFTAFCFGGALVLSLCINFRVFTVQRREHPRVELPMLVAVIQALLLALLVLWLVTVYVSAERVVRGEEPYYYVLVAEGLGLAFLSIVVLVLAGLRRSWGDNGDNRAATPET